MIKPRPGIVIVLVEPENPNNIGAVARAMKNMGLSQLRLVKPPQGWRRRAKKMAMHAHEILMQAVVFRSAEKAVADTHLVVGTTRRGGPKRGAILLFPDTIKKVKTISQKRKVAILFGKESKGMDNRSIALCDWVTTIPTHRSSPSINLAQAVMIVAFSLLENHRVLPRYTTRDKSKELTTPIDHYLTHKETRVVLDHFETALVSLGYPEEGGKAVSRIRATLHRTLKRSGLLQNEARMIKGLSRRIRERLN